MNLNKHSKVRAVGLSCFAALTGLLGMAVFCPFNSYESTYAADITKTGTFDIDFVLQKVATGNINIDFLLAPLLSISLDGLSSPATVTATPSGAAVSAQTGFTVTSNSTAGYGVWVHGNGSTNLVGTDSSSNTIPTLTADAANLSSIPKGYWGFNLTEGTSATAANLKYSPLPTSKGSTAVLSKTGTVTAQNYKLTFGANVGWDKAPDTYTKDVTVQVVASGAQTTAISETNELRNAVLDMQEEEKQLQEAALAEQAENMDDVAVVTDETANE